jgi:solute carrier family 26 (sodium-independent sulfate anion transporter), member 11
MAKSSSKVGHYVAKGLGIKLHPKDPYHDPVTRGESIVSIGTSDTFVEEQPSTADFFREITPSRHDIARYFWSLFPFLSWIGHYNSLWLVGDLVAGKA